MPLGQYVCRWMLPLPLDLLIVISQHCIGSNNHAGQCSKTCMARVRKRCQAATGPTGLRWVGMLGAGTRMSPRANFWSQASSHSNTILPHIADDADRKHFGRNFGRCAVCRWRMRLPLEWCVCRWRIRLPLENAFAVGIKQLISHL